MNARPRLLVVRTDSDGDVLLCGPAVRLAARHGDVTLLVSRAGAAAARLLPGVDDVIVTDAPWSGYRPRPLDPAATTALVADLAARRFDAAIVLASFHQSPLPVAVLLRMAGVPWVAGPSTDYPGSLLDLRLPGVDLDDPRHEAQRQWDAVAAALRAYGLDVGAAAETIAPALAVTRPLPPLPRELASLHGYVVVHPGASVPARAPRPDDSATHVAALAAAGHAVVLTGGPSEAGLTSQIAALAGALGLPGAAPWRRTGAVVDLGGATDLPTLAAVLASARAVVVGNTGPAHLAAAVGTPVVSLFAPVVPARWWRPWGVPHVLLGDLGAACRDTRARDCPVAGHPCLAGITPLSVVDAVESLAATRAPGDRGSTDPVAVDRLEGATR
ncbi:MAG: glycosyltransferase family 9 protein [Kineosporiaceae bacterium]